MKWKGDNSMLIVKVDKQPPYFVIDEDLMKMLINKIK